MSNHAIATNEQVHDGQEDLRLMTILEELGYPFLWDPDLEEYLMLGEGLVDSMQDLEQDFEPHESIQNSPPQSPMRNYSPNSDSAEGDDIGISEEQQCNICDRRVSVQFNGCFHAACTVCTKNIWWSRVRTNYQFPSTFPCPWCRNKVREVRMLRSVPGGQDWRDSGGDEGTAMFENKIQHQGFWYVVQPWQILNIWMPQMCIKAKHQLHNYNNTSSVLEFEGPMMANKRWLLEDEFEFEDFLWGGSLEDEFEFLDFL